MQNVFELRARGLIKGGTVGAALIAYGHGWYEPDILHFEADEPARHKIIDLTVRLPSYAVDTSSILSGNSTKQWML